MVFGKRCSRWLTMPSTYKFQWRWSAVWRVQAQSVTLNVKHTAEAPTVWIVALVQCFIINEMTTFLSFYSFCCPMCVYFTTWGSTSVLCKNTPTCIHSPTHSKSKPHLPALMSPMSCPEQISSRINASSQVDMLRWVRLGLHTSSQ